MAGKKQNKARQFFGGGRRPDNRKHRQEEAIERQAAYAALSTAEKIDLLDRRLGVGLGAKRQRARLAGKKKVVVVEETKE